jgi:hypothetical protein
MGIDGKSGDASLDEQHLRTLYIRWFLRAVSLEEHLNNVALVDMY